MRTGPHPEPVLVLCGKMPTCHTLCAPYVIALICVKCHAVILRLNTWFLFSVTLVYADTVTFQQHETNSPHNKSNNRDFIFLCVTHVGMSLAVCAFTVWKHTFYYSSISFILNKTPIFPKKPPMQIFSHSSCSEKTNLSLTWTNSFCWTRCHKMQLCVCVAPVPHICRTVKLRKLFEPVILGNKMTSMHHSL